MTSSDITEAPVEEQTEDASPVVGHSDPSIALMAGVIVWLVVLAATANATYYLGDGDVIGNRQLLAMAGLTLGACLVALLAATIYLSDRRRRRRRYPRGYRRPLPAGFTIPEKLAIALIVVYIAGIIAGAGYLGLLALDTLGPAPDVAAVLGRDDAPMLGVLVAGYVFLLAVIPPVVMTPLLGRRHRRRYPDKRDHEGPGFTWTSRGLLFVNTVTMVLLVLILVRVPPA